MHLKMMLKFSRISTMPLNFFPSLIISNICFKYEHFRNQTKAHFLPFSWLTNFLIVSSSLYALSFLLTCFALILFTLAFAFLRASSQLKASIIKEVEDQEEEESIDEFQPQKKDEKNIDEYSCDDSLLSNSCDETSTSEETDESEWTFGDDPDSDLTQECSDGSISDEESLIELDPKKPFLPTRCGDELKYWSKCYYSMEPFQRMHLMDLLGEIYDEENMIEIDLAVGSIKCPRFEITA